METIPLRLLTLGARVHECTDRLTLALPSSCPVAPVLRRSLTLWACVRLAEQALGSAVESVEGASAKSVR
jgi:hypothetical protein